MTAEEFWKLTDEYTPGVVTKRHEDGTRTVSMLPADRLRIAVDGTTILLLSETKDTIVETYQVADMVWMDWRL